MTDAKESLVAYVATLCAIVVLTLAAVIAIGAGNLTSETGVAKLIAALGFIGSAVTGLIGVIGTFRPKGPPTITTNSGDVNVPPSADAAGEQI